MDAYSKIMEVRWSDLDANHHLRHSVYYDWGAYLRLSFLHEHGLSSTESYKYHIGVILFREECVFKREVRFGDLIEINMKLAKCRKDVSRWSVQHEVWKNTEILSAIINVDGAWIDTQTRKLAVPPSFVHAVFNVMPKAENFEWTE